MGKGHNLGARSMQRRFASWGLVGVVALSVSAPACGQVLEIGSDGAVKSYVGPAVTTDAGVVAIPGAGEPHRRRPHRGSVRIAARIDTGQLASAAEAAELSPELVSAVAWQESGLRTDRVSRAGGHR